MLAPVYKLSGTSQGSMEQQEEQPHVKERWSVQRSWVLRKAAAFNQLEWEGGTRDDVKRLLKLLSKKRLKIKKMCVLYIAVFCIIEYFV